MPPTNSKYGKHNENLPEHLKDALKSLVEDFEKEDKFIYERQLETFRKHEKYWHGFQYLFWSEAAGDWRSPTQADLQSIGSDESNAPLYDHVENIYKAHGESIIAALSQQVPPIYFPPDDADSPDDIFTSKSFSKISELIDRHNPAKLLIIRSLFILWNQGVVAGYNYSKASKDFGTVPIPKFEKHNLNFCPNCSSEVEMDNTCPECQQQVEPVQREIPVPVGEEDQPKARELLDIFGPLNVKLAYYARKQADLPYLILNIEQHYALLRSIYPWIEDEINPTTSESEGQYGRWARLPMTSTSAYEDNSSLLTNRHCWLRPWTIKRLPKEQGDVKKELEELFPTGIYVAFVGDKYAESRDEDLDDHWTVSESSVSSHIHADPIGQPLIGIQDIDNTMTNLAVDTLEHGIPETFATPDVLDFDAYGKHEATPGYVYQTKPQAPGRPLSESFLTLPKAGLSKDFFPMKQELQKSAQFLVGDVPSIYGGPGEGNSRTFSEYSMSRAMALQRLTLVWSMVTFWWARFKDKSVRSFADNMISDERFAKKDGTSFINVFIKRAEMQGKVGNVEPEPSEAFPISSDKKRDIILQLIEMNNDYINTALYHPENIKNIAEALAFPDFYIPGADQRNKQYRVIQEIVKTGTEFPVDPEVDDHAVCIQVTKDYLIGDNGWDLFTTNPEVYQLVKQNMLEHIQFLQVQAMTQTEASPPGQPPDSNAAQTAV